MGKARCPAVALVDSGASHCFMAEHMARASGVTWDANAHLFVRLADGERRACLGVARNVCLEFLPGLSLTIDCWVVPLAMDLILG